jgi:hypothetical protein
VPIANGETPTVHPSRVRTADAPARAVPDTPGPAADGDEQPARVTFVIACAAAERLGRFTYAQLAGGAPAAG